jgi:hypothetical protein
MNQGLATANHKKIPACVMQSRNKCITASVTAISGGVVRGVALRAPLRESGDGDIFLSSTGRQQSQPPLCLRSEARALTRLDCGRSEWCDASGFLPRSLLDKIRGQS